MGRHVRGAVGCLLALGLLITAGGCGAGGTVTIQNNTPLDAAVPLIIDGVFIVEDALGLPLDAIGATYNYLGPGTIFPTQSRSFFLVPGTYTIAARFPHPSANCDNYYIEQNVLVTNTGKHVFEITETSLFSALGIGCPEEEP